MASSRRSRAFAAALILLPSVGSAQRRAGQPLALVGRLVRVHSPDTTLIAGAWVVAHRVGPAAQGPIDSLRTDAGGRFRFTVAAPESGAVYVLSAQHDGIGYFSDPVPARGRRPGTLDLAVFDTSSIGPALTIGMRNVVVTRAPQGAHKVLDIYQVVNGGVATRVGTDSTLPTWSARLPRGTTEERVGESDVPASAIRFAAGRVHVSAPFPPGEKQVVITYVLPAGTRGLEVPVDQATAEVELLLEDSTAQPSGELAAAEPVSIEGHTFRRFSAGRLAAGTSFEVRFGAAAGSSPRATLLAAVAAALALAGGAAFAVTRRARQAVLAPPAEAGEHAGEAVPELASQERLVAQLAALDERFEGREAETPPEAWAAYQSRRAMLKTALARRLAQG